MEAPIRPLPTVLIPTSGDANLARLCGLRGNRSALSFFNGSKNSSSYRLTFETYPQVAHGNMPWPPSGPETLRFLTYLADLRDCQLNTKHFVVMVSQRQ
jgi:hypothetical protein